MLSFDLRALASSAAHVDGAIQADDPVWVKGDARPNPEVRVVGRLSAAGSGKFYFSGHMTGGATGSCRRCLEDVRRSVDEDVHLIFVDPTSEEADQPDVHVVEAMQHELDLRPALREEWLLAVPTFAVCADSCLGLCPQCGANRNVAPCSCSAPVDPRWNALTSIRDSTT